jgi:hypothetical protein
LGQYETVNLVNLNKLTESVPSSLYHWSTTYCYQLTIAISFSLSQSINRLIFSCQIVFAWVEYCQHRFWFVFASQHVDERVTYVCPSCRSTYRSKNSFQAHLSQRHKDWKRVDIAKCAVPNEKISSAEFDWLSLPKPFCDWQ